jgi:hypothetical protein
MAEMRGYKYDLSPSFLIVMILFFLILIVIAAYERREGSVVVVILLGGDQNCEFYFIFQLHGMRKNTEGRDCDIKSRVDDELRERKEIDVVSWRLNIYHSIKMNFSASINKLPLK